eukprot:191143_1
MASSKEQPSVCPVNSNVSDNNESPVCPVKHTNEPPDSNTDHAISHFNHMAKVLKKKDSSDIHDIIPGVEIPATGRGNSETGTEWLNPSANQLYRALQRKNKPIDKEDALSVAAIHAIVTEQTWSNIMQYENYHIKSCPNPRLARFEGKDGIYSPKARFCHFFMGLPYPYDRHDWIVDRCGKEVQYIIDYYAIPMAVSSSSTENGNNTEHKEQTYDEDNRYSPFIQDESIEFMYTIDARPKLNSFGNLVDRARVAYTNWKNGDSWF